MKETSILNNKKTWLPNECNPDHPRYKRSLSGKGQTFQVIGGDNLITIANKQFEKLETSNMVKIKSIMQIVSNNRKASVSINYDNYLQNNNNIVNEEFWNKHTSHKFFKYKNSQIFGEFNRKKSLDYNCNNNNNSINVEESDKLNQDDNQTDRQNFKTVNIPRIGRSISKNKEKSTMKDIISYSYYEEKPSRSNSKRKEMVVTGKITNSGTNKW